MALGLYINEVSLFTSYVRNLVHLESIMIAGKANCKKSCLHSYQRLDLLNTSQEIWVTLMPTILTVGHEHYEYFIDIGMIFYHSANFVENRQKISTSCALESFYSLPVLSVSGCRKDTLDYMVKCDCDKLLKGMLFLIVKFFPKL